MVEISNFLFAYFASIIAIISLDLFLGTTLLQFHVSMKFFPRVQETVKIAATSWGLLNWLLSTFLFLNGINILFIYLFKSLYISYGSKIFILYMSLAPYLFLKKRYKVLFLFSLKNFISFSYPILCGLVIYVTFWEIPYKTINILQDIRWAIYLILPSIFIIFLQIVGLAWYEVFGRILATKDP